MKDLVTVNKDKQLTTTTLKIAETFGKRHDNVMQKLESLDLPKSFTALNFKGGSYLDKQNQERPMYNVTRDGFTFLVMGFTGKKAVNFKIAYIEAFNKMEQHILNGTKIQTPKLLSTDKAMKNYKRETELRICHLREELNRQQTNHRNDIRYHQEKWLGTLEFHQKKNNKLVLDIVEKLKPIPTPKPASRRSEPIIKPRIVKSKQAMKKFSMVDYLADSRRLKDMDNFNKRQTV